MRAIIFDGCNGLNTKYDPRTIGPRELSEAVNVVVEGGRRSRVSRRKAFELISDQGGFDCHWNRDCLIVSESGSLLRMGLDGVATEVLRSDLTPGVRMRFLTDFSGTTFYCNGHENGRIIHDRIFPWREAEYVGNKLNAVTMFSDRIPTLSDYATLSQQTEERERIVLTPPPVGRHLDQYLGHIMIGFENFLGFTEGWHPCWYQPSQSWIGFDSTVRMVRAVDDGVYVATDTAIYFLSGQPDEGMAVRKVLPLQILEYTDTVDQAQNIGQGHNLMGKCVVVTTVKGVVMLSNGGITLQLTNEKHERLDGYLGVTAWIFDGVYVALIQ